MKAFLLFFLAFCVVAKLSLLGSASMTLELLSERSELWPERISVKTELTGEKHGNLLKPGVEGIFLGMKEGRCVVDLGHNGIFYLAVEETDLEKRALERMGTRRFADEGLFARRYSKYFLQADSRKPMKIDAFASADYFLVLLLNIDESESGEDKLRQFLDSLKSSVFVEYSIQPWVIPSATVDGAFLDAFGKELGELPVIAEFLKESFIHANQHLLAASNCNQAVLVDKNGKQIAAQKDLDGAKGKEFLESLREPISSDLTNRP